jgi:DNA-binding response OmpR family regulator
VEDEFLIRAMLSDYLQDCGIKVLEASSADEL